MLILKGSKIANGFRIIGIVIDQNNFVGDLMHGFGNAINALFNQLSAIFGRNHDRDADGALEGIAYSEIIKPKSRLHFTRIARSI